MKSIIGMALILTGMNTFAQEDGNPLKAILAAEDTVISNVMENLPVYEVQILYTQINRDDAGKVSFKEYTFQENPDDYFYPASSVKLPVVILAMEKYLGKPLKNDKKFDLDTPYKIAGDSITSSFRKDISEIFAVSDNAAYNRLFEFLGRDTINAMLERKGLVPAQIVHRVDIENSAAAKSRSVIIYPGQKDSIVWEGYTSQPIASLHLKGLEKGKGYMKGDSLIEEPMDFSEKNYFPLRTQQEVLKRLFFPEHYQNSEIFALSDKNRDSLIEIMQKLPRESGYDPEEFYDSSEKFLIYGDTKDRIPPNIKIYNKVGLAYGTLTDNAYIKDEYNGVEFFLSATILVNKNKIFNDDDYEYDTVGIPFLAELGRRVYQFEKTRKP